MVGRDFNDFRTILERKYITQLVLGVVDNLCDEFGHSRGRSRAAVAYGRVAGIPISGQGPKPTFAPMDLAGFCHVCQFWRNVCTLALAYHDLGT